MEVFAGMIIATLVLVVAGFVEQMIEWSDRA